VELVKLDSVELGIVEANASDIMGLNAAELDDMILPSITFGSVASQRLRSV